MYIGTQCIYKERNVTQCIYTMYIKMLHNVYRHCTTMYPSTMLPKRHLRCISKCNPMYIKFNPMYIPHFVFLLDWMYRVGYTFCYILYTPGVMSDENRHLRSCSNLCTNFQHKILIGRRDRIKWSYEYRNFHHMVKNVDRGI